MGRTRMPALALLVPLALLGGSLPAGATSSGDLDHGSGSISGTVTNQAGELLADICVDVYDRWGDWIEWDLTDVSGNYRVPGLTSGDHRVQFYDCGEGGYVGEWYDDKPDFDSADPVPATDGQETSGIDAVLAVGGSISGTVTNRAGEPLKGMCVDATHADTGYWAGDDVTGAAGSYRIIGLETGSYKIEFSDCTTEHLYVREWYDDKQDEERADPVAVTAGSQTSGIDAQLALGGSISGTVTNPSGQPLEGIDIEVYEAATGENIGDAGTDASGKYLITGLRTGEYKIRFLDQEFDLYPQEWYDDKPDWESADPVGVVQGSEASGIDAVLSRAGFISGRVTDRVGKGVQGVCVDAYLADTADWVTYDITDASGSYLISRLETGEYKIYFWSCQSDDFFFAEWYDDKPDLEFADSVPVARDSEISRINAVLTRSASISGTVRNEVGEPLADICVGLHDVLGGLNLDRSTDASGSYRFTALPPGTYKLHFEDCAGGLYFGEWWDDAPDWNSADPVEVAAEAQVAGIDAVLALGGSISGTVTDEAGQALAGICVDVHRSTGGWVRSGATDSSGRYRVTALESGQYVVFFIDCVRHDYFWEWYDDKLDFDSADPVPVTRGQEASGVNAALIRGTPTTLSYRGPSSGVRGQRVTLYARLTDFYGDGPDGRLVRFELGSWSGEGVTNFGGWAGVEVVLDQAPGSHELKVSFAGDADYRASADSETFEIRWEYTFTDQGGAAKVFLNPSTSEFQFSAPGDETGIKRDPAMQTVTLPTGDRVVSVSYRDTEITLTGEFHLGSGRFVAVAVTASGTYVLRRV